MANLNKVLLMGNLTRDPEMRYTQSGTAVTSFAVAANRRYTRDGEAHEETVWFRVSTWGAVAEAMGQYLAKGRQVMIVGEMKPAYAYIQSKSGQPAATLEVSARTVQMLGPKSEAQLATNGRAPDAVMDADEAPF